MAGAAQKRGQIKSLSLSLSGYELIKPKSTEIGPVTEIHFTTRSFA